MANKIRLASELTLESVVDGPGLRTVIWCQGCTHNCPQCHNLATHCLNGGFEKPVDQVIADVLQAEFYSGVTFSGGEPMLQAEGCAEIACALKQHGINIWCYSGFCFEALLEQPVCRDFLQHIDVLVDGPFIAQLKSYDLAFRGSSNQRLIAVADSLRVGEVVLWINGR